MASYRPRWRTRRVEAHGGAYTIAWSIDNAEIASLKDLMPDEETTRYTILAPGEVKITCKFTCADGYTAEAYAYIYGV